MFRPQNLCGALANDTAGDAQSFARRRGATAGADLRNRRETWRREEWRNREQWRDQERRRAWELARERERQRELLEQLRIYRPYPYTYPNSGYYGYNNYGYGAYSGSSEEQRGYRDGLDRGREDAQTHRIANPNNSSHYRSGNAAYRAGFYRGYFLGYRQYSGYRPW